MAILYILLSVAAIVLLITRLKLHPFLALLLVSIVFGLISGMPFDVLLTSIERGFGDTLGKIGLIIILGVIIGAFLEHTGGAMTLAENVLAIIGKKRVVTAMGVVGYIISIPVFADSGFILVSALNKSLTKKAGVSLAATSVALAMGLMATHTLVPPTPGPIAAAGILNADLGKVILLGLPVAAVALIAALIFSKKVAAKTFIDPLPAPPDKISVGYAPGIIKSALPIVIPIVLIILKSLSFFLADEGWQSSMKHFLSFVGDPVIALIIGCLFCLTLPATLKRSMLSTDGWVGEALLSCTSILLITGAGGIFGKVLQNSEAGELMGNSLSQLNIGIWLPFILSAAFKSAQGSSTVALITTASIMVSLMPGLGYTGEWDKVLVVLAIGAGSMIVSHANDSFFWVVTQMSGMDVKTGYRLHTLGSGITGVAAMLTVFVLFKILH